MNAQTKKALLDQLNSVMTEFKQEADSTDFRFPDGQCDNIKLSRILTRAKAVIVRVAGKGSPYYEEAELAKAKCSYNADALIGVVESLQFDIEKGFLDTFEQMVHGELFADYLEMAAHLLKNHYKDAAALIAGSTLEEHLRTLCRKFQIDVEVPTEQGPWAKKAEQMNQELAGKEAYEKGDQKSVTAWLNIRNDAAHGHYDKYSPEQVQLLIDGVRDFFNRKPA